MNFEMNMESIYEPERKIPVIHETDIVVIGGSCTGVFAAVQAARLGMRVAIIEQHNCFGGMATTANVNIWHSLQDTEGKQPIISGLTREVIERLHQRQAVIQSEDAATAFRLNTEELKIELDEMVLEHDIVPYFHTMYTAPVFESGRLHAVIIENKNGRQAIRAQQFIDASGDGVLARQCGVPFRRTGSLQPPTLCAKIAGYGSLEDFDWQKAISLHGAEYNLQDDWGWGSPIPGLHDIQMRADTHVFNCDTADSTQLTHAEIEGRRQVRAMLDIIRKYGPAKTELSLVDLAASIGTRETSRIEARYQLKGDDVLYGRRFLDAIANGSYRVDIHHAGGPGITFRYLDGTERIIPERGAQPIEGTWRDSLPRNPTFYQIPFRCLVQDKVPNLMVAGRMLDADKVAFSAVRVMVNMNQTGEAAGVACALAIKHNIDATQVNPNDLRETLKAGGSIIL